MESGGATLIRLTMIYARFGPHDDFDAPLIETRRAIGIRTCPHQR